MLFASTVTFTNCWTSLLIEYERESPSASDASRVPIDDLFSSTVKEELELIIGLLSLILFIVTVISWVIILMPSLAVTVAV